MWKMKLLNTYSLEKNNQQLNNTKTPIHLYIKLDSLKICVWWENKSVFCYSIKTHINLNVFPNVNFRKSIKRLWLASENGLICNFFFFYVESTLWYKHVVLADLSSDRTCWIGYYWMDPPTAYEFIFH